jgi:hypothetical protein
MTNKWGKIQEWAQALGLRAVSAFFGLSIPTGTIKGNANDLPGLLATRIYHILTNLAYPLAFVGIIYSAYLLLTSMGSPEAYAKTKKNIIYITTGIALIVFTAILFRFVQGFFANL